MFKKTSLLILTLIFLQACSQTQSNPEKTPAEVGWQQIKTGAFVIDVRSPAEFAAGHLDGAINIPHDTVALHLSELPAKKDQPIVVYCKSGRRAGLAIVALEENGYTHLTNAGGYEDIVKVKGS